MKFKNRYKVKYIKYVIIIIIITIILNFIFTINYVGNKVSPIINEIVIKITNDNINHVLFKLINKDIMGNIDIDNIIKINMHNDEIISVDYKMNNIYNSLSDLINNIYNNIVNLDVNHKYYDKDNNVFKVPLGVISSNVLISNLGPKIPCKVEILRDVNISYKTKIIDYGINNSLLELYIVVDVKHSILNPFYEESFGDTYEILVGSRLVVGKVPSYYGGTIEKNSAIVSS